MKYAAFWCGKGMSCQKFASLMEVFFNSRYSFAFVGPLRIKLVQCLELAKKQHFHAKWFSYDRGVLFIAFQKLPININLLQIEKENWIDK